MEQTPVLDQVFGLAMFVKTGNEEDILKKANWYSLTDDMEVRKRVVEAHPYLEKKLPYEMKQRGIDLNACTPDEYDRWRTEPRATIALPISGVPTAVGRLPVHY